MGTDMNAKRTPAPWRHSANQIVSGATEVCEMSEQYEYGVRKANAQFIVTACNAHDDLVAALEWWQSQMESDACDDMGKLLDEMSAKARAALARAKGEA